MTFYLVEASPRSNISEIRYDIDHDMIQTLVSFGKSLQYGLQNARRGNDKYAMQIEKIIVYHL
ncbi:MAG: hypothetical protein L0H53_04635 [Candidatus Nitrosocosmicus sp.]|nr:hypothetical protein [Candidatus Nitrosocosmicus sp.]MDN5867320.1 hypothetical protein [Candidatus Nitrosocosmicus sp.]